MSTNLEVTCDACGGAAKLLQHSMMRERRSLPSSWVSIMVVADHHGHELHLCPACILELTPSVNLERALKHAVQAAKQAAKEARSLLVGALQGDD